MKKIYTFIDLFAGIGGFHTAMHYVGGKCVFASEWDKNARLSYEANYKKIEPNLFKKDKNGRYLYFNEDIMMPYQVRFRILMFVVADFLASLFLLQDLKEGLRIQEELYFSVLLILLERKLMQVILLKFCF